MQHLILNNFLLNDVTEKILGKENPFLKKAFVTIVIFFSLMFYGFESLINGIFRRAD